MKRTAILMLLALSCMATCYCQLAPSYSFTRIPLPLRFSYYDYMIGSFYSSPLHSIPFSAGGGYFATYHSLQDSQSPRRVYYSYLDASGNFINDALISSTAIREGYPTLAVDPVSGKPLYAWHADVDGDNALEVVFTADQFIAGVSGLFNTVQTVIDNPVSITAPDGSVTTDNQFLWPSVAIGPSPVADKRRIYIVARNYSIITQNILLAYADYNAADIESEVPFIWSYTSIPLLNAWHVNTTVSRNPSLALACDEEGNVYLCGYHRAWNPDSYEDIDEPYLDVFCNNNFGMGEWTYHSANDRLPAWNPAASPTSYDGYFTNDEGIPYPNNQLSWRIMNSSHLNCSVDNLGRLHVAALWGLEADDGKYFEELQFLKEFVYNPATQMFSIHEIYPKKSSDDAFNAWYQPWDILPPFGVTDGWTEHGGIWTPNMHKDWNFCLYDHFADADPMFGTYNNIKLTQANPQGWMAAVWQSSWRARQDKVYDDPAYAAFSETPEIMLSISPNNGDYWSPPVSLNNVETPEFIGLTPMWAYPADTMVYTGYQGNSQVHKLGLLFYDDYYWFANIISAALLANPGGEVMFAELQFNFPSDLEDSGSVPPTVWLKSISPNPFREQVSMQLELSKATELELTIYNLKGQLVKKLYRGNSPGGLQSYTWDGRDDKGNQAASGIYFCRISSLGRSETQKLVILR